VIPEWEDWKAGLIRHGPNEREQFEKRSLTIEVDRDLSPG
jgi:hypothetical protein